MMKAYSLDLRERVVSAYEDGIETIRELAEQFLVSESFIKRMLAKKRGTGDLSPRPHGGGQSRRLSDKQRQWLLKTVLATPDITLSELQRRLLAEKNVAASVPTLSRELRAMNLRRKKNRWSLVSDAPESEPGTGAE
jgi:transposase